MKNEGIPENQAEAISEAFKDAQGEADIATKADLGELEQRLIIKLAAMIALAIAVVAVLVE